MTNHHDGGCMCGHVRYRLEGPPLIVHCCHCTECQRQTGSAFAVNVLIEHARLILLAGELAEGRMPAESGRGQTVYSCPECRVVIWSHYANPKIAFVRAGTLDEPQTLPPDIHIFTRSKLPWVEIPHGAQRVEAFYDRKQVWPAASLARIEALAHA